MCSDCEVCASGRVSLKAEGDHCSTGDGITSSNFAHSLCQQGLFYMPFTVDPFGGMGHSAHQLLHGSLAPSPFKCSPDDLPRAKPHTKAMLQRLQSLPRGLLSKASDATTSSATDKIFTPAKWAQQCFGLYVNSAMTTHIHTCLLYTSPSPRDLSTSRMPSSA